jgi:hypothetical protein
LFAGFDAAMKNRGFLNADVVWRLSFWTISVCIAVSVLASILAIWEFAGRDVLWRTVATCVVVGAGTLSFAWVNALFGRDE